MAQVSGYHEINNRWAVMGNIAYTNWGIFNQLTLKNTLIPGGIPINITAPLNYHNTFDYAVGANFKATDKWLFKTGFELLQSPTNNRDRIIQDPVGVADIVGIGAHYQQNKALGYDVGYEHAFFHQQKINHVTPFATETGVVNHYANFVGAQLTWNIV